MASVKISDLPSGSPVNPGDVLIYNDTGTNTTKKVESKNMFYKALNPTITCNATLTKNGEPYTPTFNLSRVAPHIAYMTMECVGVTATNATNANIIITFSHSHTATGDIHIDPISISDTLYNAAILACANSTIYIKGSRNESGTLVGDAISIPANSSKTISFVARGLVYMPIDA